jgi:chromosome segregation ATPase
MSVTPQHHERLSRRTAAPAVAGLQERLAQLEADLESAKAEVESTSQQLKEAQVKSCLVHMC